MTKQASRLYEFGPFRMDPSERTLLREGRPVPLTSRAFDALSVLIQAEGHLFKKSDLMAAVWKDNFVEENNLAVAISMLRKALGDEGNEHKYIQTVARHGYRFVANVREIVKPEPEFSTVLGPASPFFSEAPPQCRSFSSPLSIGREQEVNAILRGQVETSLERVRVTVQLVRVPDGSSLWAGTFEEDLRQIFELEDQVAERVDHSMSIPLSEGEKSLLACRQTENSKAYQLYLHGRYFWNKRTEEGLRRSIEYFRKATIEDPQYALAHAGLADSYVLLGSYGVAPPRQAYPGAKAAALKALDIDNTLAEAHASLGQIAFCYEWNWPKAGREFRRAIASDPNCAMTREWYALYLIAMGGPQEALDQIQRARELDPVSLIINTNIGHVYDLSRQFDQAINAYRQVLDLEPQFARAHARLGMTYAAERAFGDAIREFEKAKELAGPDPYLDGLLGYAQARSGNAAKARELCGELTQLSRTQYVPAFSIALVYVGLDEQDRALDWLYKAYQERSSYMIFAKIDPLLDPLRSDPRFGALLHQMGFS